MWQAAQGAFDLCVYELDDSAAHQYTVACTCSTTGCPRACGTVSLHHGRAVSLVHQHRDADRDAEMAFAGGEFSAHGRTLAAAARLVVDVARAGARLARDRRQRRRAGGRDRARPCPGARVARVPTGVPDPRRGAAAAAAREAALPLRVVVCEDGSPGAVERAAARARQAGANLDIVRAATMEPRAALDADVVVATRWPSLGRPLFAALVGAAAGKAVVVAETESTASWPALDPQAWQPRALATGIGAPEPPMAISIDPRDEEHSLVLALTRLAHDAALRSALGSAARAWWARHATVAHAVAAWQALIDDAASLPVPPRPAGWPAHLDADGGGTLRAVLDQLGIANVEGGL